MTVQHPASVYGAAASEDYLRHDRGLMSWLFTLDHKRIGVMYLASIFFFLLFGGALAMLVRAELWTPGEDIMKEDLYNRTFTLHGAVMIFLFILPGIPAALGNFVLPLMLGAKDVAFPRLNLASLWIFWIGSILAVVAILYGGIDTGWTFYTPYSIEKDRLGVIPVLAGVFILGFSGIFTGVNFLATMHKMRPPGMTWFRMPLFLWGLYGTAVIQVVATPVLGVTLMLLIAERTLQVGIFDPKMGGDPVLFQHFFWFYSHPAVYIMILPAMGVVSETITTFSRKPIFGYKFIALSSIAIAVLGFMVWGHHMFVSGQSVLAGTIFSALTFSVSIPSAIKVFNWLATMYKGSIYLATPMWYALAFIALFGIGGLTGLFLATLTTNMHLTETYFVVSHFHFVMVGSVLTAFLGGLYYWWPKITGRLYNETVGKLGCLLLFIGFNVTFFPQFPMGTRGMPRRYYAYDPEFQTLHQISSVGAFLMGFSMLIIVYNLFHSLRAGRKAPANPWGGATLEWVAASPPRFDNFEDNPSAGEPYDRTGLRYDPQTGNFVRQEAEPAS